LCPFLGTGPAGAKGGNPLHNEGGLWAQRKASSFNFGAAPYKPLIGGAERMTVKITLACTECKQRNYNKEKNKKNNPDRLEMKKYCRFCKKHTVHRETK
jgi:large subunit ribosomal protein L33